MGGELEPRPRHKLQQEQLPPVAACPGPLKIIGAIGSEGLRKLGVSGGLWMIDEAVGKEWRGGRFLRVRVGY